MEKSRVTKATLGRLPQYLSFLRGMPDAESSYISATRIAKELSLGEVQVRKDLNLVCGMGKPKLGYRVAELVDSLENCLGQSQMTPAVLVGAGKLGRALLEYDGFEKYGVRILAAFDRNEQILNPTGSKKILPMSEFEEFCREHSVKIGIITVGESSAQTVCDRMIDGGISAVWNFAPCKLRVPNGILLYQENLAISLAYLNNQLLEKKRKEGEDV